MRRITLTAFFLVLATAAVSSRLHAVRQAERATRAEDALTVQRAIHDYTAHIGKAPKSLNDLVTAGYLKALPGSPDLIESDPIIHQNGPS
jgi:general secretion pathway protein G